MMGKICIHANSGASVRIASRKMLGWESRLYAQKGNNHSPGRVYLSGLDWIYVLSGRLCFSSIFFIVSSVQPLCSSPARPGTARLTSASRWYKNGNKVIIWLSVQFGLSMGLIFYVFCLFVYAEPEVYPLRKYICRDAFCMRELA